MKMITIPIIKEWGETPEYKTIFNVDDELAKYIKTLEETSNHIFANVNDDELLRSNAMNYKEAQEYKNRIDKAIEYIKNCGGMELVNDYSFPEKPIIDKEAKTNLLNILKGSE